MGQVNSSHVRIYNDLVRIGDPATRVRTLETVLLDPSCVASARQAGIYGSLLNYIRAVRAGERAIFPGTAAAPAQIPSPAVATAQRLQQRAPSQTQTSNQIQTYRAPAPAPAWEVVSATPSSKALDYLLNV